MQKYDHITDPKTGLITKLDPQKRIYLPSEWGSLKLAPVEYLIEGLLPAIGTSLVVAQAKTGKGTLTRQMSIAISNGDDFLGRKSTRSTVLYCSRQERLEFISRNLLRANKGVVPNILISPLDAMLKERDVELVRSLIKEAQESAARAEIEGPRLIVLDMLESYFKSDNTGDQYKEAFNNLEPLQELANDYGGHIQVIHHATKAVTPKNLSVRAVLGSGAIAGSVDQVILMCTGETSDKRCIMTVQRDGEPFDKHWLDWDKNSNTVSLGNAVYGSASTDIESTESKVLAFIETNQPVNEGELAKIIGNKQTRLTTLAKLVKEGKLSPTGEGVRGDPKLYSIPEGVLF